MKLSRWHSVPEFSEEALEIIATDLRNWQISDGEVNRLERMAETWTATTEPIVSHLSDQVVQGEYGTAGLMGAIKGLETDMVEMLAGAYILSAVKNKVEAKRRGTGIGLQGKRAVVTVQDEGVGVYYHAWGKGTSKDTQRIAAPGETFSGEIDEFISEPELGGRLRLSKFFGMTVLTGLVNPETAEPRIALDVLAKY